MLRKIWFKNNSKERRNQNSFQLYGKLCLQTHGAAMGTKMAVAFAEILKTEILKPLIWKRHIDDIFSLWTLRRGDDAVH